MLSFTRMFGGLLAAAALAVGLAGAAPAATLSFSAQPAASAGPTEATATARTLFQNVPAEIARRYGTVEVSAVPAPAAGLLLLTAVGAVSALRRRKAA